MIAKKGILMICLALFLGNVISAQTFKYIGADKCKMCHNKPATGDQYGKWSTFLSWYLPSVGDMLLSLVYKVLPGWADGTNSL